MAFRKYYKKCLRKSDQIVCLHPLSPGGGIGRRAGLKHQFGNKYRFDPGPGHKR